MTLVHHNPLNLLRALAVLAVFCHHFQHYAGFPIPYLGTVGGLLGVQLFFLVSGYLIVQSASRQHWARFLVGRAFRIFPVYWVALVFLIFIANNGSNKPLDGDWPYFFATFFALSHFFPYAAGRFDVFTVGWTLTVEWTWYLLAPLLVWGAACAARRGVPALRYWSLAAAVSLGVSVAWVLVAQSGRLDGLYAASFAKLGLAPNEHLRTAFLVAAAPAQWVFFLLGVLLWVARDALARWPTPVVGAVALVFLVRPAWWPQLLGFDPSIATGLGLCAVFLLALRLPARWENALPLRWAQRLGDWSYPIYLLHVPVLLFWQRNGFPLGASALLGCVFMTLALSAALHHAVENPGRRLGVKLLERQTKTPKTG